MPTVPNRYYNSPWIAQASQNLASALYPDPEAEFRSLQMRQIEGNIARQAEMDARTRRASTALSKIPTSTPETLPQNLADVFEPGGPEYVTPALTLGSVIDPNWAIGGALAERKGEIALEKLKQAGVQKLNELGVVGAQNMSIQQMRNELLKYDIDLDYEVAKSRLTFDEKKLATDTTTELFKIASGVDEGAKDRDSAERIAERNNRTSLLVAGIREGTGGQALDVDPEDEKDAIARFLEMAEPYGAELQPDTLRKLGAVWSKDYQTTRDSPGATERAWASVMGKNPQTPGILWGEELVPDPALKRTPGLGDVVTAPAAPPPVVTTAPTAAPAAARPPAAAPTAAPAAPPAATQIAPPPAPAGPAVQYAPDGVPIVPSRAVLDQLMKAQILRSGDVFQTPDGRRKVVP